MPKAHAALLAGALLTGGLTSCAYPDNDIHSVPLNGLPKCTTDTVTIRYNAPIYCDLTPPQTLIILLPDASDASMHYCDDMGGQIALRPDEVLCLNVDY